MALDGLPRLETVGGPSLDSDYALNVSLILNPTRSINEIDDEVVVPSRSKAFLHDARQGPFIFEGITRVSS